MYMDQLEKTFLHVHYRACLLEINDKQIAAIERFFGLSRMINNHLLLLTKDYPDDLARQKSFTYRGLEREVLKFMNDSNHPLFVEGLLTPGIMKGILVAWLSEWNDFCARRIQRPVFKRHQDPQSFYIIDNKAVEYTENKFKMVHCHDLDLRLKSSKYPVSNKAPVHLLKRTADGEYWLYSLHERVSSTKDTTQDDTLSFWCDRILALDRECRYPRSRYLSTSGARRFDSGSDNEIQLMNFRKITLDRLLRAREANIKGYREQDKPNPSRLT